MGSDAFKPTGTVVTTAAVATTTAALFLYRSYRSSLPKFPPARPDLVLDAIENKTSIYYFGVGSNLSRKKLENRSVCGEKIHILNMEPCVVPHYRLAFNMRAFPPLEPAMGSLEPLPSFYAEINGDTAKGNVGEGRDGENAASPFSGANSSPTQLTMHRPRESVALRSYENAECHGALIKLSADDYERVYKSEGGGTGPLQGYEEIVVTCLPYDKSKSPVKAVAFRARDHVRLSRDPCPSKRYMGIIREGAKELGLEPCYIKWLDDHPVQDPSPFFKKFAINSMIFTVTVSMGLKIRLPAHVQSRMLFMVYVLPTEPKWKHVISGILSGVILFPTACAGVVFRGLLEATGKMPPRLKRWVDDLK